MDQRRKVVALGALLVAGAIIFVVVRERRGWKATGGDKHAHSDHNAGVEHRLSALVEMAEAPEGATTCETVWNAYKVYDEVTTKNKQDQPHGPLPPRDVVIARCNALPEQEQKCLMPRYFTKNQAVCQPLADKYTETHPLYGAPADAGK
jgi:hypothetical protein